jgi:hypothetical protein
MESIERNPDSSWEKLLHFIIKRAGHPGQNNFGRSVEGREIEE